MKEVDMIKKRHLELLAFGKAGVFCESVYVTENGDFKIPKIFSDEERDKLYKLVWSGEIFTNGKENQRASQYLEKHEEDRQAKND